MKLWRDSLPRGLLCVSRVLSRYLLLSSFARTILIFFLLVSPFLFSRFSLSFFSLFFSSLFASHFPYSRVYSCSYVVSIVYFLLCIPITFLNHSLPSFSCSFFLFHSLSYLSPSSFHRATGQMFFGYTYNEMI